jgi:hypothetical protein
MPAMIPPMTPACEVDAVAGDGNAVASVVAGLNEVGRTSFGVLTRKLVIVNGMSDGGVEGVFITPKYTTLLP